MLLMFLRFSTTLELTVWVNFNIEIEYCEVEKNSSIRVNITIDNEWNLYREQEFWYLK